jgi:hypothetical protein
MCVTSNVDRSRAQPAHFYLLCKTAELKSPDVRMRIDGSGGWRGKALVIMPFSAVIVSLLLFNLISLPVSHSAVQCKAGEAACFCKAVGGSWLATPTTIHPTCRKSISYQGTIRESMHLAVNLILTRTAQHLKVLLPDLVVGCRAAAYRQHLLSSGNPGHREKV